MDRCRDGWMSGWMNFGKKGGGLCWGLFGALFWGLVALLAWCILKLFGGLLGLLGLSWGSLGALGAFGALLGLSWSSLGSSWFFLGALAADQTQKNDKQTKHDNSNTK
jgi:hypothetical protein